MKILLVNKFYYPQGGADIHVMRLEELLRAAGHEVAVFAMADPRNRPSPWSKYFVSHVDFSRPKISWQGLRVLGRMLWSFEAERKMRAMIAAFQPDVIHVHNIYHQLSPSIFRPMRQAKIPVVQTLHDYAMISPNYSLFANGSICEDGKDGNYFSLVQHRAIKQSLVASLVDVLAYLLQGGAKPYLTSVKKFISPSIFLSRYVQSWLRTTLPITVIPNFTESNVVSATKEHRLVYVGRLSSEKGVEVLLRAMEGIDMPLDIIGTGPQEQFLRDLANELHLTNITWHGQQPPEATAKFFATATATIVPSVWYENYPLTVLESFAQGTPVIGSDIGGIPELVQNEKTGALVSAGEVDPLHRQLVDVQSSPERWRAMREQCLAVAAEHTPSSNPGLGAEGGGYLKELLAVYEEVRA